MAKVKFYEAVIEAVFFDKDYSFEDVMLLGISNSFEQTENLINGDIVRLAQDYEPHRIDLSESTSQYGEPIQVVKYAEGYAHYYCIFTEKSKSSAEE